MKFLLCELKTIVKSIDGDERYKYNANGGCIIHPVPVFGKNKLFSDNNNKDGGSNQNLILFIRGNAISGDVNISGIEKFPNPPTIIEL